MLSGVEMGGIVMNADFNCKYNNSLKWIDVECELPEDYYEVLVVVKSYVYNAYYYAVGSHTELDGWDLKGPMDDEHDYVAAWAELPDINRFERR